MEGYCHSCGNHQQLDAGSNWCGGCLDKFYGRTKSSSAGTNAANRISEVQKSLRGRPIAQKRR